MTGHAGYIGLGGEQLQVALHRGLGVQQPLVHVHVQDLRAILHLLAGYGHRVLVPIPADETPESRRSGHVSPLSDVDEVGIFAYLQRLDAAQERVGRGLRSLAWRYSGDRVGDGARMLRTRSAAAADYVRQTARGELAKIGRHVSGGLVVFAELVGQTGVRVAGDEVG